MAKVHFAQVERGNESQIHDEWGPTMCGMIEHESPVTNKWDGVTCKKCISKRGNPGFDYPKIMTGKELVDCGKRIDSNGFLIANTLKYEVLFKREGWIMVQMPQPSNNNKK